MARTEMICLFSLETWISENTVHRGSSASALSLKLSEIALVKNVMHDAPVLLLDDVLSELDGSRQNYLLDHINSTQTIITCTGLDEFIRNRFQMNRVFEVTEGKVSDRMGGSYEH